MAVSICESVLFYNATGIYNLLVNKWALPVDGGAGGGLRHTHINADTLID